MKYRLSMTIDTDAEVGECYPMRIVGALFRIKSGDHIRVEHVTLEPVNDLPAYTSGTTR